jgi:hypothetical protein
MPTRFRWRHPFHRPASLPSAVEYRQLEQRAGGIATQRHAIVTTLCAIVSMTSHLCAMVMLRHERSAIAISAGNT